MLENERGEVTFSTSASSGRGEANLRLAEPSRPMEFAMDKRQPGPKPRAARRRGRPPKYGRPARLVAVTLPHDVVDWLASLDADVGRAIVRLHDVQARRESRSERPQAPGAEFVDVGDAGGLIVVDPKLVRGLAGIAAIPFGEGRAFLALDPSWNLADLELSIVDALDRGVADAARRTALLRFRDQLREWRNDRSLALEARSIIVAGRRPAKAKASQAGSAGR
jgi:hypothetical protein